MHRHCAKAHCLVVSRWVRRSATRPGALGITHVWLCGEVRENSQAVMAAPLHHCVHLNTTRVYASSTQAAATCILLPLNCLHVCVNGRCLHVCAKER